VITATRKETNKRKRRARERERKKEDVASTALRIRGTVIYR
jgi:hypothetical protein